MGKSIKALILIGAVFAGFGVLGAQEDSASETTSAIRDSAKVWYSIGKDYFIKKRYEDAVRNFKRALEYDSTFVEAYLDMARAYLALGNMDSAEVAYRKVAQINPHDSRGWQGLGFLYGILKKDVDKGVEYYRKALDVDPENNDARFGLASLLDEAGRAAEADSVYLQALARDPDNPGIKRAYGLFLNSQGRYAEAVKYLKEVLPVFKDDEDVRKALLDACLKSGEKENLETALEDANYLIQKDSTNYTHYLKRAAIYEKLGKYRLAYLHDLRQDRTQGGRRPEEKRSRKGGQAEVRRGGGELR